LNSLKLVGPVSLGAFLLPGMDLYGAWWPRTVLATFTFRQRFFVERYRRIIHLVDLPRKWLMTCAGAIPLRQ